MRFCNNIDIVKFFRKLVHNLKPFAANQDITLSFQTKIGHSAIKNYNPDYIQTEITNFLNQLIKFIPPNNKITILFDEYIENDDACLLTVTNTGMNLFRVTEIVTSTKFKTQVKGIDSNSSEFTIEVPLLLDESDNLNKADQKVSLSPYYLEIGKRLSSHFSNTSSFMADASKINTKETTFLKKKNALLSSKLEDNTFKVDEFAREMAMSRTQLFRKIKALTNMSPSQYILHFRLQAAKELLLAKNLDLNVSDVCYSVGFMSKSHFTRSFQKQFGMLPSQIKPK